MVGRESAGVKGGVSAWSSVGAVGSERSANVQRSGAPSISIGGSLKDILL